MVKVSFNSALAQKEAAKKEEENSQVLILPPDAKVSAGGPEALGPARLRALRCAQCCRGQGSALAAGLFFVCALRSSSISRGQAGGESSAAVRCAPPPLAAHASKMADRRASFKAPLLPTLGIFVCVCVGFFLSLFFFFTPTALGSRPTRLLKGAFVFFAASCPDPRRAAGPARAGAALPGQPGRGDGPAAPPPAPAARPRPSLPGRVGVPLRCAWVGRGKLVCV